MMSDKFEGVDNETGDNNDPGAPGHETEYLLPVTPERLTFIAPAVTDSGTV